MQMPAVRVQARLYVPEALTSGQLRECKCIEMTSAAEIADPLVAAIASDNIPERPCRKVAHHLAENRLPFVHLIPLSNVRERRVCAKFKSLLAKYCCNLFILK